MPSESPEFCLRCGHAFDPHLMVTTGASPKDGGVMLCNVKGCLCYATWSAPQLGSTRQTIRVPDDDELARMRKRLQTTRNEFDEEFSAEEFDRRLDAGTPVDLDVKLNRPEE